MVTAEEEEALFEKRVIQINRRCLETFKPYIVRAFWLAGISAATLIGGIFYYANEIRTDVKVLIYSDAETKATIVNFKTKIDDYGKDILELQRKVK